MLSEEELDSRFTNHAPSTPDIAEAHETIRGNFRNLTSELDDILVEGREKSLAITKIEEAMFWANAALARSQEIANYED